MPELIHDCGKKVRFPSGMEGKRGRCPHCGGSIAVPAAAAAAERIHLDPPPHWEDYLAYLEDRGPAPRQFVMPNKLMLQTEADEHWERRSEVRPSRFLCPSCKDRLNVDQLVCLKCGLDLRSGRVLGKDNARLSEKGMAYLAQIPWLQEAKDGAEGAEEEGEEGEEEAGDAPAGSPTRGKVPRRRKRRS